MFGYIKPAQERGAKNINWLLFMLLLIAPRLLPAQKTGQARTDSLLQMLPAMKEDTNKVKLLREITLSFQYYDKDKAIRYGNENLAMAQKLSWAKGIIYAYEALGNVYKTNQDTTALSYFRQGSEEAGKNHFTSLQARQLVNEGNVYYFLNDYVHAAKKYKSAFEYFHDTKEVEFTDYGPKPAWFKPAQLIGMTDVQQHHDEDATSFFHQILIEHQKRKDLEGTRWSLQLLADNEAYKSNFRESLEYSLRELDFYKGKDTSSSHWSLLVQIADTYQTLGNYETALEYLQASIAPPFQHSPLYDNRRSIVNENMRSIFNALGDYQKSLTIKLNELQKSQQQGVEENEIVYHYLDLASIYTNLKQYDKALSYFNTTLQFFNKIKSEAGKLMVFVGLAEVYYFTNRYDEALSVLKDSTRIETRQRMPFEYRGLFYLGLSIRDAPDEVLIRHGIVPALKYKRLKCWKLFLITI